MRRYGDNGDLTFLWPVAPEEPVGTWRLVLHVRFENFRFLIVRMFDRVVFVCIEARVSWVIQQQSHAFLDLLEQPLRAPRLPPSPCGSFGDSIAMQWQLPAARETSSPLLQSTGA